MTEILTRLIGIGCWISVIVLILKEKFKIAIPLVLLHIAIYPIILGLIFQYTLSQNNLPEPISPVTPYSFGCILIILFILSILVPHKHDEINYTENPPFKRWLFFTVGLFFYFASFFIALMCWFAPNFFGKVEPMPMNGVVANIIGVMLSALFLYFSTKNNSFKRPNFMRKILILLIFLFFQHSTLTLSFVLIYSFPTSPKTMFPSEAGINMLAYVIWAILLISIKRECVKKAAPILKNEDAKQIS